MTELVSKQANQLTWTEIDHFFTFEMDSVKKSLSKQLESSFWKIENIVGDLNLIFYPYKDIFGYCIFSEKIIFINSLLTGYDRDVTLFHELVHYISFLKFNDPLIDGYSFISSIEQNAEALENRVLIEYVSRRSRAKPRLLKSIITYFGLAPQIYDKSSFLLSVRI